MAPRTTVSIVKTRPQPQSADVEAAVRRAVSLIGGIDDIVQPGALVIVNPNMVANPIDHNGNFMPGVCTRLDVTRTVAQIVKERGARPVIAESTSIGADTEQVYRTMGYDKLRDEGFEVIDLKQGQKKVTVECPKGKIFKDMTTWEIVAKADVIISVPIMKTHDQTEVTLGIKNLKGLYTDAMKKRAHMKQLFQQIADWASVVPPALTVIDGIVAMEGMGPEVGIPVEMDLIVAGKDPVATDTLTAAIMGFQPEEILLCTLAAEHGLGTNRLEDIEVVGEPLESVRRRFLRNMEDDRLRLPNVRVLHSVGTCSGCRNAFHSAIHEIAEAGFGDLLAGTVVLTGEGEIPPDVDPSKLVTIGRCVPRRHRVGRAHVPGCAPNRAPQLKGLLGGHPEFDAYYDSRPHSSEDTKDFF